MEMMIWSGPFAISWDLAFSSDSLLLGARWRWDLAFGRDFCFVCARWRYLPRELALYSRVDVSAKSLVPQDLSCGLNGAYSYPSQDLYWGPNRSACAVPVGIKQTASAADKAARTDTALSRRSRINANTARSCHCKMKELSN